MTDPTPAQLAKAREITAMANTDCDYCLSSECYHAEADRAKLTSTIAAALADEAQQARPDATAQARHLAEQVELVKEKLATAIRTAEARDHHEAVALSPGFARMVLAALTAATAAQEAEIARLKDEAQQAEQRAELCIASLQENMKWMKLTPDEKLNHAISNEMNALVRVAECEAKLAAAEQRARQAALREAKALLEANSVEDLGSWIVGPAPLIAELRQLAEEGPSR